MADTSLYTLPDYPEVQGYTPSVTLPDFTGSQLGGGGVNATLDAGPSTSAPYTPLQQGGAAPPRAAPPQPATQGGGIAAPKGQSQFWPTTLAVLSALSGNFGPAIQLEEQKRKTELYKYMDPHLRSIESMTAKGEYDKSSDMLDQLMMRVGDRAPEILPFLKEERAQLRQKHENYNAFKNYTHYLDATLRENDPRRETKLKFMQKILNNPGDYNVDSKLLDALSKSMQGQHIQIINGVAHLIDPDSQRMTEMPVATAFEMPKGYSAAQIQAATGMTPNNLTNAMNGLQFEHNGQTYQSTPELRADLSKRLAVLTGTQSQLEHVAPLIPTSPEQVSQQQQLGIPNLNIAGRTITPGQAQQVQQGAVGYQHQLAQGQQLAQNLLNANQAAQAGQGWVSAEPDTFGTQLHGMTDAQGAALGSKVVKLPQSVINERVQPTVVALHNVQQAMNILPGLGIVSDSDYLGTATQQVREFVQRYTGVPLRPEDSGGVAARIIANRAIEELGRTGKISEAAVGQLKGMVTSSFASSKSIGEALKKLNESAQYELGLTMRQSNVQQAYNAGQPTLGSSSLGGPVPVEAHQGRQVTGQEAWLPIAQHFGVPADLVKFMERNEQGAGKLPSKDGAIGLFQVLPRTAQPYLDAMNTQLKPGQPKYTVADLNNDYINAYVAIAHMADLYKQYRGNYAHVKAAYVGGPSGVNADGSLRTTGPDANGVTPATYAPGVGANRPKQGVTKQGWTPKRLTPVN